MQYRTVGIITFAEQLKFGLSNRIDQFVEQVKQKGMTDRPRSADEWTKEYIKWMEARYKLESYMAKGI